MEQVVKAQLTSFPAPQRQCQASQQPDDSCVPLPRLQQRTTFEIIAGGNHNLRSGTSCITIHDDYLHHHYQDHIYMESVCSWQTTVTERLEAMKGAYLLPGRSKDCIIRRLCSNAFVTYRKVFTMVFLINGLAFVLFMAQLRNGTSDSTYRNASTATSANICIAILTRNEYMENIMSHVACCFSHPPLRWFRYHAAAIYSYAGVRYQWSICAALWYLVFCDLLIYDFIMGANLDVGKTFTASVFTLLAFVLFFAHPPLRIRSHRKYEKAHRIVGWSCVACIVVQVLLLFRGMSGSQGLNFHRLLVDLPSFWFLVIITCCVVYPWTRFRLQHVDPELFFMHTGQLHARAGV